MQDILKWCESRSRGFWLVVLSLLLFSAFVLYTSVVVPYRADMASRRTADSVDEYLRHVNDPPALRIRIERDR